MEIGKMMDLMEQRHLLSGVCTREIQTKEKER